MNIKLIGVGCFFVALAQGIFAQGSITPSGAPAPMFKTLQQIEPRVDIATVPGEPAYLHTIAAGGSYYLSTNVTPTTLRGGIKVDSDNVTIDLNGFAVNGAGIGSIGIYVSTDRTNLTLRNGSIKGWTSYGIDARTCYVGVFENLQIGRNGDIGLACGRRGWVRNCLAVANASDGFYVGIDTAVENCIAEYNGRHGINIFEGGCRVESNNLLRNVNYGLYVPNGGSLIIRNSAQGNATNYNVFSFNSFGPISAGTGVVTNHPWANFSF